MNDRQSFSIWNVPRQFGLGHNDGITSIQSWFVVASLPAFIIGTYVTTENLRDTAAVVHIISLVSVSLGSSLIWHALFARVRGLSLDPGWLMHGWLFCLLVPWTVSLPLAAFGVSFGVIVGTLIFGGTGRYIVSPALLGVLLLELSYPTRLTDASFVSTWQQVAGGADVLQADWLARLLIQEAPNIGSISTAACAFGFAALWFVGAASARIVGGALLGLIAGVFLLHDASDTVFGHFAFYWHAVLGALPFCVAFIATDPSASATTRSGRWLYGFLFGILVVALRVFDPKHPEASLQAVLLVSLFAPLIDQGCVRFALYRRYRSMKHLL